MQAVEATIEAAEVALEELQRLFSALAADEQEQRLPPGIAARAARLAELAGVLGETAGLLQGPAVAAHRQRRRRRVIRGIGASAHRLGQRLCLAHQDGRAHAGHAPDAAAARLLQPGEREAPLGGGERGGVERCGCGRRPVPLSVHC